MTAKEIKQIISQLKTYELRIFNVPEEVAFNKDIIKAERKFGLRKSMDRGFDVINQLFFVEEVFIYKNFLGDMNVRNNKVTFENFEEFYDFLEGDIYTDACYTYCDFEKYMDFLKKNKIDKARLEEKEAYISSTIDDMVLISSEELIEYEEREKIKKLRKNWIKKFNLCSSGSDLDAVVEKCKKSKLGKNVDVSFFLYAYIFNDITDKNRFKSIMEYVFTRIYRDDRMIMALCSIYDPDEIVKNYNFSAYSPKTNQKHKKELKDYIKRLKNGEIEFGYHCFFDDTSHYFCEETIGFEKETRYIFFRYRRYFENFDEFIACRKGNLKGADLSKAIKLDVDFSKYEMDEKTKLPIKEAAELECTVEKEYQNGKFYVRKLWENANGCLIKQRGFSTSYFFDFVYFLKNDLSNADLSFCDGLAYLPLMNGINFEGALMRSKLYERFGIKYESYTLNADVIGSFECIENNEEKTALALKTAEETSIVSTEKDIHSLSLIGDHDINSQRIYYITDIHLMHKLENAKCKSWCDIVYVIHRIIDNIVKEAEGLLLIGGDVSSDYKIFEYFIKCLNSKLKNKCSKRIDVVFVLGNHELWEFAGKSVDEIIKIYRELIEGNGMHFIQNELLYKDSKDKLCKITYDELIECDTKTIRNKLQSTRLVIFGGLGFSGYNEEFNANQGIYRNTLDRMGEIEETETFEILYNIVVPIVYDKNVIIFTHTPKKSWCCIEDYHKNFIYVSGHTHRNDFYDDGDYRIYCDNQIGYHNENPHLKSFLMDTEYDVFSDYEDGIYEITSSQYKDFYRGKNISINFNREINILYMLKKSDYYCFIHKSKSGSLSILNGGALKKLDEKDVQHYYDHMDEVISYIKTPLDKYTSIQNKISEEIQKLGGTGKIHGCIIDVDCFNHIYVNPVDLTIVGYWASNMVNKIVYPDIPSLLKFECPALYDNYIKLIEKDTQNLLIPREKENGEVGILPQKYLSTDIYAASREISKMQKLSSNILSSWYENPVQVNELPDDKKYI